MDDYTRGALSVWRNKGSLDAETIANRFKSWLSNESEFLNGVDKMGGYLPQTEEAFHHWCCEMEIPFPQWEKAWAIICDMTLRKSA